MTLQSLARHTTANSLHLVEEVNHRVVNEYAEAISSLRLAAAEVASRQVREAILVAADRLRSHADVHRALLSPAGDSLVDLSDYVSRYCACLAKASFSQRRIGLTVEADEVWLPADQCWRLTLILAELIRNGARHGLAGRPGNILVRICSEGDRVTCIVCDDGRSSRAIKIGRGRSLVLSLAAEIGAQVEWLFLPQGCLARVNLPAQPERM